MCTQALWLGLVMCTKAGSQNTKNMALPSSPPLSPINNRQSPTTINQQSKVAVARLVVRTGNAPSLVALWPQAEERDEHGWQVGGGWQRRQGQCMVRGGLWRCVVRRAVCVERGARNG